MLITFEGTEFVGKSTQVKILADRLTSLNYQVITTREPGGTEIGEMCRRILKEHKGPLYPETELLLMNASRAQLVREVIRPALAAGKIVICDRYSDSSVAYQRFGRGLDGKMVVDVIRCAIGETTPQLTILLVASRETQEERRKARLKDLPFKYDRFEASEREFFDRVENGYMALAEHCSHFQVVGSDHRSVEEVAENVWEHVLRFMPE